MTSDISAGPDAQTDPLRVGVRVSTSIPSPVGHVWEVLISPDGAAALLGQGAALGGKGEPYHAADGTHGVVRSFHPLQQLRVSWHESPDSPPSLVEIDLVAEAGGTRVSLLHEHLRDPGQVGDLDLMWSSRLAALGAVSTG